MVRLGLWSDSSLGLGLDIRLRLGGGMGGSVLIATPDSVNSTFIELQLLMPQHHIHRLRLSLRVRLSRP